VEHYGATRQPTRRSEKRKDARYRESGELLLPSAFLKSFSGFPTVRTTIDLKSIVEVRIVPKKSCYEVQIVYKIPKTSKNLDVKRAYSIDIGANELIALTNNFGEQSILVRGRPVKSINQWMNKKIGALRSVQTQGITFEKGDELSETMEMNRIRRKRDNVVNDYFHKTSRFVIDRCLNSGAKNLAIGYNSGWKKDLLSTEDKKMGHRQRQSFAYIPFSKLIEMIRYKAELVGINVSIIRESHTSKCSSVDFELIEHHNEYMGIRGVSRKGRNKKKLIKEGKSEFKTYRARGLFRTKDGYLIHSDINASYNIGRRAFPELFNEQTLSKRDMLKSPISVQIA
jgi:putative transposase